MLGDCFTDEKLHEMRIRNAVTSAKKINPLQIMKDLKSPAASSYISSAKKALMEDEGEFDEDDKIEFQLSAARDYNSREITGKENVRNNHNNILVERFSNLEEKDNALKNFVNANKFDFLEPDYNLLESPEKSNHKHSKSRSRTKEKRNNRSDGEPENLEVCKAESFERFEDNTCMMIDFNNSPDEKDRNNKDLEETSKSLEWILAKNIDKKKRDEICRIIGEEESRNTAHEDNLDSYSTDRNMQQLEVEEVKRVRFGNSMIRNENIGFDYKEDNGDSNLGQYIECLESVESSANKSVKAVAEKDILMDKETTAEYMTDEILSMMLYNDIHD